MFVAHLFLWNDCSVSQTFVYEKIQKKLEKEKNKIVFTTTDIWTNMYQTDPFLYICN